MRRNLFLTTIIGGVIISLFLFFSYAPAKAAIVKKPKVVKVTPKTGAQGNTLDLTIAGKNFVDAPTVSLGTGITVNTVQLDSATQLTVNITIASDAKKGPRKVVVTNPDGKKSQPKSIFRVTKSTGTTTTTTTTTSSTTTTTVPQVTAKKTTEDLLSPSAAGWTNITASSIQTTGNPATGGHGNVGGESGLVPVKLQAAHDSTNIFMRFEWNDSTQNNTSEVWTYSASSSTWSMEGNEDRILMAWPITDIAGREGKTFQQIGCAMLCHLKDTTDSTKIIPNTTDAVNDCSVCHPNSSGKYTTFVHPDVPESLEDDCASCHGGQDREIEEIADMGSPAGGAFDIWHWKAGRSDPINLAEDQVASDGGMRTNDGAGLTSNNDGPTGFTDRPKYIWTAASGKGASPSTEIIKNSEIANLVATNMLATVNATDGKYYLSNGTTEEVPTDGAKVRRRILKDGTAIEPGNGDIKASSGYSGGKWAVVLKRKINTTDTKDYVFKTGASDINFFGFAVTDNSGNSHKAKNLLKMIFEQ